MKVVPKTDLAEIDDLAKGWGLGDWDVMLVGDGSGQGWNQACGWAATLIDRQAGRRKVFYGGMNLGSCGLAELIPYVQGMCWYSIYHGKDRQAALGRPLKVAIVTDCEALAKQGAAIAAGVLTGPEVRANRPFWVALMDFERQGYLFSFKWIPRATLALNCYADFMAGSSRVAVKRMAAGASEAISGVSPPVGPTGRTITPYDCNPDPGRPSGIAPKAAPKRSKKRAG